jgi:hypothetical protein
MYLREKEHLAERDCRSVVIKTIYAISDTRAIQHC